MNVVAMLIFMTAGSPPERWSSRRAGAGLCDRISRQTTLGGHDPGHRPRACAGAQQRDRRSRDCRPGTLGSGRPSSHLLRPPEQLVFIVLLVASVMEAAILWYMPETAELRRGARLRVTAPRACACPPARAEQPSRQLRQFPISLRGRLGGFLFLVDACGRPCGHWGDSPGRWRHRGSGVDVPPAAVGRGRATEDRARADAFGPASSPSRSGVAITLRRRAIPVSLGSCSSATVRFGPRFRFGFFRERCGA